MNQDQFPKVFFVACILLMLVSIFVKNNTLRGRLRAAGWIAWFVGIGVLIVASIGATS